MDNGHTHKNGPFVEEPSDYRPKNATMKASERTEYLYPTDLNSAAFTEPASDRFGKSPNHSQAADPYTPRSYNHAHRQARQAAGKGVLQNYLDGLRSDGQTGTILPTPEDLRPGQNPADLISESIEPDPNLNHNLTPNLNPNLSQNPNFDLNLAPSPNSDPHNSYTSNSASPEPSESSDPLLTSFSEDENFDLSTVKIQNKRLSPDAAKTVQNGLRQFEKNNLPPADFYDNIRYLNEVLVENSFGRKIGSSKENHS